MRIPNPGEVVTIEYAGKAVVAIVDNVQPDPDSPRGRTITLGVNGRGFQRKTQALWCLDGKRFPAVVQEVWRHHEQTKIALTAITD